MMYYHQSHPTQYASDYALNLLAYLYHLHCYHINIELSLANCDSDALIVGAHSRNIMNQEYHCTEYHECA